MSIPLRRAVGSLMVVGLAERELSSLEKSWLQLIRPGGVILFRRNIGTAAQTRSLLEQATEHCAPQAFRCVDMEGGTVDRLRNALTATPSAQEVFLAAQHAKKPALIRTQAELIAKASRAFGLNTTLAPVLDLALPISAGVMGTRAVSADPQDIVQYAREFLNGLKAHGVVGCGKHFPGLGGGTLDSHLETPAIDRTLRAMQAEDLVPYRALRKELPMVMVSHAAFPRTPGKDRPASASAFWMTQVLRKQIGYRGIVFSDDLEMGGILKFLPIEDAAVESLRAGMEMIEICHSPELILRAYEAVLAEAERSAAFRAMVEQKARKLSRERKRLFAQSAAKALTEKQMETLRTAMSRFAETIQKHNDAAKKAEA